MACTFFPVAPFRDISHASRLVEVSMIGQFDRQAHPVANLPQPVQRVRDQSFVPALAPIETLDGLGVHLELAGGKAPVDGQILNFAGELAETREIGAPNFPRLITRTDRLFFESHDPCFVTQYRGLSYQGTGTFLRYHQVVCSQHIVFRASKPQVSA
jgi:hypothetical protein